MNRGNLLDFLRHIEDLYISHEHRVKNLETYRISSQTFVKRRLGNGLQNCCEGLRTVFNRCPPWELHGSLGACKDNFTHVFRWHSVGDFMTRLLCETSGHDGTIGRISNDPGALLSFQKNSKSFGCAIVVIRCYTSTKSAFVSNAL